MSVSVVSLVVAVAAVVLAADCWLLGGRWGGGRYVPNLHVVFNLRNPEDTAESKYVAAAALLVISCACSALLA